MEPSNSVRGKKKYHGLIPFCEIVEYDIVLKFNALARRRL